jgi:hypothetical protein
MKKQLIIIGIIVLLITVGLSGCADKNNGEENNKFDTNDGGENNTFVGTWKDYPGYSSSFTFLSNGTGLWTDSPMLWEIKDGILEINPESNPVNMTYYYTFSDDYQILTLTFDKISGITLTLVKQ